MKAQVNHISDQLAIWSSRAFRVLGLWIVALAVIAVSNHKLNELRAGVEAMPAGYVSTTEKIKQLECLTRNIYWEAASEPFEGKVAVAQVTMNRVASGRFAPDVCGVVYQKNVFYDRVVCQFSWYCEGTHRVRPIHRHCGESQKKWPKKS